MRRATRPTRNSATTRNSRGAIAHPHSPSRSGADSTAKGPLEALPSFKDVPAGERQALFIKKLKLCSVQMDFSEHEGGVRDKELKRLNLLEIMDYINNTKGVFNEQTFPEVTAMISANLFRGLAPTNTPHNMQYDPEEDEPVLEASWPHLQVARIGIARRRRSHGGVCGRHASRVRT